MDRRTFLGTTLLLPSAAQHLISAAPCLAAETAPRLLVDAVDPDLFRHVHPLVQYRRVPLADSDNAWPAWLEGKAKMVPEPKFESPDDWLLISNLSDDRAEFPTDERAAVITQWIDANQEALKTFDAGTARCRLQFPLPRDTWPRDVGLNSHQLLREFSTLKSVRARMLIAKDQFGPAARELFSLFQMTELILRGEGLYIDHLIGAGCQLFAAQGFARFALEPKAPANLIVEMLAELSRPFPWRDALIDALRVDYCCDTLPRISLLSSTDNLDRFAEVLLREFWSFGLERDESLPYFKDFDKRKQAIARLLADHPRPLDKAQTVMLSSGVVAEWFADLAQPWCRRKTTFGDALRADVELWPKQLRFRDVFENPGADPKLPNLTAEQLEIARQRLRSVDNPVGKSIAVGGDYVGRRVSLVAAARRDLARLVLAIRLYEIRTGALPPALAALVENKVLPEVPQDPFGDGPLHYSREKALVWTIGPEGDVNPTANDYDPESALTMVWPLRRKLGER